MFQISGTATVNKPMLLLVYWVFENISFLLLFQYVSSLVIPHYDRLKWKNDGLNHVEKLSQVIILNLACRNGHQPCLEEAGNKFLAWIKDKSAYIPPNVRSLVYQ